MIQKVHLKIKNFPLYKNTQQIIKIIALVFLFFALKSFTSGIVSNSALKPVKVLKMYLVFNIKIKFLKKEQQIIVVVSYILEK
jgi:hypothetical protein